MSTRALGRLYGGMANNRGPSIGGGDGPSLLASLFGQANITSPEVKTLPDGSIQVVPAQGSKGIFGGWSRAKAAEMNAPMMQQYLEGLQNMQMTKESGEQQRQTVAATAVAELAKHLGVTPDQITGALKDKLSENATQEQVNRLAALNPSSNPDIQGATNLGENIRASGINPANLFNPVSAGQVQALPSFMGKSPLMRGPLPTSNTTVVPTKMLPGPNGQMTPFEFTPVTKQGYSSQGGISDIPVAQDLINQAQQLAPPQSTVQPQPPNPSFNMNNAPDTGYPDNRAPSNPVRTLPPGGAGQIGQQAGPDYGALLQYLRQLIPPPGNMENQYPLNN